MTNAELIDRIKENYQVHSNSILDMALTRLKVAEEMAEALSYMSKENNYNDEDGLWTMKRPGGGYQSGIVQVSHDLHPRIMAQQALSHWEELT